MMTRYLTRPAGAQSARRRLDDEAVAELVDAAAAEDQRAWNRLVEEFSGMIWAVARAHRLGDADAADVARAVWLALLEHLDQLKDRARIGAWLATTARRECLRVLREGDRSHPFGDDAPELESNEMPPARHSSGANATPRCGRVSPACERATRLSCDC